MRYIQHFLVLILLAGFLLSAGSPLAAPAAKSGDSKNASIDSARPNYIEFPQMMASVLEGYRVRGMMVLGFGLEIENNDLRNKTRELLPRLQDTYTREFNQYAGTLYRSGDLPNAELISKRMQLATDQMLGEGNAVFLISNLMVRHK